MSDRRDPPAPAATEFSVQGMNCQSCVRKATAALEAVPGLASVVVSLEESRATVRWQPDATPSDAPILRALQTAGYAAEAFRPSTLDSRPSPWSPLTGWQFNVVFGGVVTLVLMLGEWAFGLGMVEWFQWTALLLALPVQVVCGARFYVGAWRQLRVGGSNMDTLVSLGSTTAFGFSAWALFTGWHGHLWFMEAAAIITLISVGHWLEARMSAHAASSLKALLNLAPPTARRLRDAPRTKNSPFDIRNSKFNPSLPTSAATEEEVPVAQLRVGDRIVLRPGDRVPVDAEVLEGQSAVDEAMLTGESLPVEKSAGAKLYGGTVNQNGRLVGRVTATGDATALAQIIAVVQRAQSSRANIQKLGDRVSAVFVPIVVLVALGTGLWWGLAYENARHVATTLLPFLKPEHFPASPLAAAFIHAAGVLIVACPCAMGLATPAAIMAGVNAAARRGILIRDGAALEKSGRITAVLFDKTGTLTEGKLAVAAVEVTGAGRQLFHSLTPTGGEGQGEGAGVRTSDGFGLQRGATVGRDSVEPHSERSEASAASIHENGSRQEDARSARADSVGKQGSTESRPTEASALALAAALAAPSNHPLSRAIAGQRTASAQAQFKDWREVRGAGVEATIEGIIHRLGSLRWLTESGAIVGVNAFVTDWTAQGATVLGLTRGPDLLALFALRDQLKPNAAAVLAELQRDGQAAFLVTGDNPQTAAAIAAQAGVPKENVFAEIRPEQKSGIVQQLQARGQRVAFVGDGINDAPALTQADLGIAVIRASDVAREAADIILLKADLEAIPEALGLAQATLRTIKQNLFWAFFYNAAAVPLAALGLLSPVVCAAAMGLSDVLVIGNALRLRGWRRK